MLLVQIWQHNLERKAVEELICPDDDMNSIENLPRTLLQKKKGATAKVWFVTIIKTKATFQKISEKVTTYCAGCGSQNRISV